MDLSTVLHDGVIDIESFNDALRQEAVSATLELPKGVTLYPKPIDTDAGDDISELEVLRISCYKPDSEEEADPEYAMIMDYELEPTAHVSSPAFVVLYKSRLYYMDAYALFAQLFVAGMGQA